VATDDARIEAAVRAHGFDVCMTRADHACGTDRLAEAAAALGLAARDIVINVQGDEPFMPPALIAEVARSLESHADASLVTACHRLHDAAAFANPNVVKVVLDARGYAMYFSRAGIPHPREGGLPECYRHIGIYAYRAEFLACFGKLAPAPMERSESLEQLRALWHGYRIAVAVSSAEAPPGVDTPGDLDAVRASFDWHQSGHA
jgi:3-deoxy-manno-octulosonate cytidylyltransferase (CMP-KDO synthetase)